MEKKYSEWGENWKKPWGQNERFASIEDVVYGFWIIRRQPGKKPLWKQLVNQELSPVRRRIPSYLYVSSLSFLQNVSCEVLNHVFMAWLSHRRELGGGWCSHRRLTGDRSVPTFVSVTSLDIFKVSSGWFPAMFVTTKKMMSLTGTQNISSRKSWCF